MSRPSTSFIRPDFFTLWAQSPFHPLIPEQDIWNSETICHPIILALTPLVIALVPPAGHHRLLAIHYFDPERSHHRGKILCAEHRGPGSRMTTDGRPTRSCHPCSSPRPSRTVYGLTTMSAPTKQNRRMPMTPAASNPRPDLALVVSIFPLSSADSRVLLADLMVVHSSIFATIRSYVLA
jgi:hypothetical protein